MRTRSLAALAAIRARIARRRRANADAWVHPDRSPAPEVARLTIGAKVGSYLAVLTESNVRGMLRRKVRLAADPARTPTGRVTGDAGTKAR